MADDFDALLLVSAAAMNHDESAAGDSKYAVWPRPQKVGGDGKSITKAATLDRVGRPRRLQQRRLAAGSAATGRTRALWVWA